jgi:hypothetical protein
MRKTRSETTRRRVKTAALVEHLVHAWRDNPPHELTLTELHAQVIWQLYDQAERTVMYLEKLGAAHTKGAHWYARRLGSALRVARGMVHAEPILPRGARVGRRVRTLGETRT